MALAILIAVIAAGYYLASPLFINVRVAEESPRASNLQLQGGFVNADDFHTAEGTAKVILTGGERVLRFEQFKVRNGPDLYVYLAAARDVSKDFVNLGRLKGNEGEQNYIIPSGTDLAKFRVVLIWCRAFITPFGYAELGLP